MMKRIISFITAVLLICVALSVPALAAYDIDTGKDCSLEIIYKKDGKLYEGLTVKVYRVADLDGNLSFTLADNFKDYPVRLYSVESQAEWRSIANTLAAYAVADKITPTATAVTDKDGAVKFEELTPGMYLTLKVRHLEGSTITVFENFLTVIPRPDHEGNLDYDITAYPKSEIITKSGLPIQYKVVKQWRDNGSDSRTDSVKIDIYREGEFVETVILSETNSWTYAWDTVRDGSDWIVVERDVPPQYTVTTVNDVTTFIVTNSHDGSFPPPETGDTGSYMTYIMLLGLTGSLLLLVAIGKKRREE